jgi:hypothetical protein
MVMVRRADVSRRRCRNGHFDHPGLQGGFLKTVVFAIDSASHSGLPLARLARVAGRVLEIMVQTLGRSWRADAAEEGPQ